ncbi:uncharacterized protein B0T15DRAFT_218547 [Chaetomium strumarium]|uniref:HNH nuclease domain-containing protein n=1 Tax=Chaetomium strumarium TaxID=1170767 RepID=A0AAJ0GTZ1_9PEZI|nr:hypothetical protein B0T15DRAFT_218547 [Chaetomium strumarium]
MQEPDWHGMLAEFLQRDSTNPIRRDTLRRILEMDTEREPTGHLLPVDEAKEKLNFLRKLERYWEEHFPEFTGEPRDRYKPLGQLAIATVMMMDFNTFRGLANLPAIQRDWILGSWLKDLMVMPCFVKKVMTKNLSNYDSFLLDLAEGRFQELDAQLHEIQRKQQSSSESYDDKKPQLSPIKSKTSKTSKTSKKSLKLEATEKSDQLIRSQAEKAERAMLDNHRCVVLGTGNPEIFHIVPFSLNDNEKSRTHLNKYLAVAATLIHYEKPELASDPEYIPEDADSDSMDDGEDEPEPVHLWAIHCRKFFSSKIGVSDRSWNMISLNRQLHNWWSEGYFAFKPLGIDGKIIKGLNPKGVTAHYTRVKLQFHWMPRRKDIASRATTLDISENARPQDFSDLFNKTYGDLEANDLNPVFAQDRQSSVSHQVQTGDIFYVKVEHRYAERMLAAFRIQWATVKILSLAGGAESLDDVGDSPDYLDENLNWMGDVKRGMTIPALMKEWDD